MKKNSGITIIALSVTIVVISILSGIVINSILSQDDGIVTMIREAKENEISAQREGQERINAVTENQIYNEDGVNANNDSNSPTVNRLIIKDITSTSFTVQVNITEIESGIATIYYQLDDETPVCDINNNRSTIYTFEDLSIGTKYSIQVIITDTSGNVISQTKKVTTNTGLANVNRFVEEVPIPKGFYYVGGTKNEGIVISDSKNDEEDRVDSEDLEGNQFVWVPVLNNSDFHLIEGYNSGALQNMLTQATNPSREAGSTLGVAGTPLANNNTTGTSESVDMYNSINTYKGFYIARFEAGIAGITDNHSLATKIVSNGSVKPLSKKGIGVWNDIVWGGTATSTATDGLAGDDTSDGVVKIARSMYPENNTNYGVKSTLCYGVQWDAIMNFIDSNYISQGGSLTTFVANSTDTGNYTGTINTTGYYSIKNIYDLAGNVSEWTQEACNENNRVTRGGSFSDTGQTYPSSGRNANTPDTYNDILGFRVSLIL